jgi:hypothetical protein
VICEIVAMCSEYLFPNVKYHYIFTWGSKIASVMYSLHPQISGYVSFSREVFEWRDNCIRKMQTNIFLLFNFFTVHVENKDNMC